MVLMANGGTLALSLSYFAFRDAQPIWPNILLEHERRFLRMQRACDNQDILIVSELDSRLDINFRETGTEVVDRTGMDVLVGFGAAVVGIGTIMAIGGANPHVHSASNLLSGYIGIAPVAFYELANTGWSLRVEKSSSTHHRRSKGAGGGWR
jgi:hypothetical protein